MKYQFRKWEVNLVKGHYTNNDNLAISMQSVAGEPIATITVNTVKLEPGLACIDINNLPDIMEWLLKNDLITLTKRCVQSGFCNYPVVRFKEERE